VLREFCRAEIAVRFSLIATQHNKLFEPSYSYRVIISGREWQDLLAPFPLAGLLNWIAVVVH
jgi:hypothetical protein